VQRVPAPLRFRAGHRARCGCSRMHAASQGRGKVRANELPRRCALNCASSAAVPCAAVPGIAMEHSVQRLLTARHRR